MKDDFDRLDAEAKADPSAGLSLALRGLGSTLSFMQTGAHPDDESSALLARLIRAEGLRVSYACATRGEGGQNALGPERGAALGLIRTLEMAQAARSLGGALYWIGGGPDDSIRDFGFSKNPADTLRRWNEAHALERLVGIVRRERPDILCPAFLDVEGQHGHHRAIARLTVRAFEIAGDAAAFPDQIAAGLAPWAPALLYLPAWSGAGEGYDDALPPPPAHVAFDLAERDPVALVPYLRIGEWSRRFHRSQGMGRWVEPPGAHVAALHLAADRDPAAKVSDRIGQRLPATLGDWADATGEAAIRAAHEAIAGALALPPGGREQSRALAAALTSVRAAQARLPAALRGDLAHRLARKERELSRALWLAQGALPELVFAPSRAVAGAAFAVRVEKLPPGARVAFEFPDWIERREHGFAIAASARGRTDWSRGFDPLDPRDGQVARVERTAEAVDIAVRVAARDPFEIMPALSARFVPAVALAGAVAVATVTRHCAKAEGRVRIETATGDVVLAAAELAAGGAASTRVAFDIADLPARDDGVHDLRARVADEDVPEATPVAYPHAGAATLIAPARLRAIVSGVVLPKHARVAYFGAGFDRIGARLADFGFDMAAFDAFDAKRLAEGGFTTALIGIQAFAARADLRAGIAALHAFVRGGGHLVTLYHKPGEGWRPDETPLARLEIGSPSLRWRACDPAASVEAIDPAHPLLTGPNRIADADWQGWRGERGLYFARDWDDSYRPLLCIRDPGETAHLGAVLSGRFGAGRHTHVALALHAEIEAGTQGAVRLLANFMAPATPLGFRRKRS